MKHAPLFRTVLLSLGLPLLASAALAAGKLDFGGELNATFGVAFDGSLPVASACLRLGASGEVGSGLFPEASFEAELKGCYDAATGDADLRLGRAYATVYLDQLDLVVGQQLVFWGSTDAVNPVDVLNPRDLSFPVADPEDQKLPAPMIRATFHAPEDVTIDLVLIPVFTPSELPAERWQTDAPASLPLPPGVTVVGRAPTSDQRPAAELRNVQFGVRTTLAVDALDGADVSVSYVRGTRTTPTVSATLVPTQTPGQMLLQPVLSYDRYSLVGLDFSVAAAQVVIRGEAAYTFTDDPGGNDPAIGNPGYQAVLEAEHTFPGGALATLQAIVEHTNGDAGQDGTTDVSGLATIHYEAGPRLTTEAAWLHDLSDGSGMVRPRLSYAFADGVTGTADLIVFYGRDGTRYGDWRDNGQLRVGLAYAF